MSEQNLHARRVAMGMAALWVAACVAIVASRIAYPLELEWMEGGSLQRARWIADGRSAFPAPTADFVPFLYTPLYAYVLAALGTVLPLGFTLGRLVSVVAWIAVGVGIWRAVRREGKPMAHAAAAVGLMCSGYVFTFRWLDIARPDAMFIALVVWALVLLRESWGDHRKAALAGLLMALAFWTKQTAFVFVLASGVGALLVAPRQSATYAGVIAVVAGGGVLLGNALTDGQLWTYIYELHQSHAFNSERFTRKTWGMFAHAAPFVAVLVLALLARLAAPWVLRQRRLDAREDAALAARMQANRGVAFWMLSAVAGLVVSALGYSTQWAEPNAFIPGVVLGAIFVGTALPTGGRAETASLAAVVAQMTFALLLEPRYQPIQSRGLGALGESYVWQDLSLTFPASADRARAAALREDLEQSAGAVFALHRPWWGILAGGPGHVGSMGVRDVGDAARTRITAELRRRIRGGEYEAVWLEGEPPAWLRTELGRGFRVERRLEGVERVRPMTGYMSEAGMVTPYRRPQLLMTPMRARVPPAGGRVVLDFERGALRGLQRSGRAFGTRPVRPIAGKLPAIGPHGGEFFLSSATAAGRVDLTGTMTGEPLTVRAGEALVMLLGDTGRNPGVRVEVVGAESGAVITTLQPAGPAHVLSETRWAPEQDRSIRLRFVDEAPDAALFVDDVWVVPAG